MYIRMLFLFVRTYSDFCVRMYADFLGAFYLFIYLFPQFFGHMEILPTLDNRYFEMSRIDLKRSAVSPQTHTSFLLGGSKGQLANFHASY
jgi:hypothetical protein